MQSRLKTKFGGSMEKRWKKRSSMHGLGGLTIGLGKMEGLKIGDDTILLFQRNNTTGSAKVQVRIIAPQEKRIDKVKLVNGELIQIERD